MKKAIKILPLIILGMLCMLLMSGRVVFGAGLGDIFYYGLTFLGLIIYGVYLLRGKESAGNIGFVFPIVALAFCGYIILVMTIWRGPEYRWNGDILVPTQKTIEQGELNAFEKELDVFDQQISERPNDYDLRVDKGFFLRSEGKFRSAIDVFKAAQEIAPGKTRAYLEAGYAYGLMKDYQNAVRAYEKAYQIDTTNQELKAQIGRLKERHRIE